MRDYFKRIQSGGASMRLKLTLAAAALSLAAPLIIIVRHSFAALERESFLLQRSLSEETARRIDAKVQRLLQIERERPIEQYSFLNFSINTLDSQRNVAFSPLSDPKSSSAIPGARGYFEIDQFGGLQTPILPQVDLQTINVLSQLTDSAESAARLRARDSLARIVSAVFPFISANSPLPLVQRQDQIVEVAQRYQAKIARQMEELRGAGKNLNARVNIDGQIVIYRVTDLKPGPFLQGVVLNQHEFFNSLILPEVSKSTLAKDLTISIIHRGSVLYVWQGGKGTLDGLQAKDWLKNFSSYSKILAVPLDAPLQELFLVFTRGQLSESPQSKIVSRLAWVLSAIFLLAAFSIYYATTSELSLAQEKENFVSAVTHELKTPLTSIRMYSELLNEGWVDNDETRRKYHEHLCGESDRLSRLVSNVLSLAGMEQNEAQRKLQSISAKRLVENVLEYAQVQADKAGFKLELEITDEEDESPTIDTQSSVLEQILLNFIENALKFAAHASNKTIKIGYRTERRYHRAYIIFFVRDFGDGVRADLQRKIFKLFFRAEDEMTRSTQGTGIGLALVKKLADYLGASIGVRDAKPGAEFWIRFKAR